MSVKHIPTSCAEAQAKEREVPTLKQELKLLQAGQRAQTDRADFVEDCIAEMAAQVYNV